MLQPTTSFKAGWWKLSFTYLIKWGYCCLNDEYVLFNCICLCFSVTYYEAKGQYFLQLYLSGLDESPLRLETQKRKWTEVMNRSIFLPLSQLSILNNVQHMQTVHYIKRSLEIRKSDDQIENTLIRELVSCSNIHLGTELILLLILGLMGWFSSDPKT